MQYLISICPLLHKPLSALDFIFLYGNLTCLSIECSFVIYLSLVFIACLSSLIRKKEHILFFIIVLLVPRAVPGT